MATVLPVMFIALTLPHLDADLSNNRWQCDCNISVFQNFISESWMEKWNRICSESINVPGASSLSLEWLHLNCKMHMEDLISLKKITVSPGATTLLDCDSDEPWGENETYWWIPYRRVSENTKIPHISLNQMKKLVINKAEKPLEGLYVCFSTSGRKKHIIYKISVKQKRALRWVRRTREVPASTREASTSQDLTLAVCLSVIITFLCAFCLGAFVRPYIDHLWQQRCQSKSSISENAYSNEGFYDDTGDPGNPRPQSESQHQDSCSLSIYETRESPDLYTSVIDDGKPKVNRLGEDQEQRRNRAVPADKRNENWLPENHDVCPVSSNDMNNVLYNNVISVKKEHVHGKDISRELTRDLSSHEDSRRASSIDRSVQNTLGPFQSHSSELEPTLSKEKAFTPPQMSIQPKAQSSGENGEIGEDAYLPSEVTGTQKRFSKETRMSSHLHPMTTQQKVLDRSNSGSQYEKTENKTVLSDDPRDVNHSILLPSWENDLEVDYPTHSPTASSFFDQQNTKNINNEEILTDNSYDSDEGSLFTLSSTDSDYNWKIQEIIAGEREHEATWPSVEENCIIKSSSDRMDSSQSESPEDNASIQKTFQKCDNEKKEHFESIISRPGINLSETNLPTIGSYIGGSNKTRTQESPPNSEPSSPISIEIPGMFIYDHVLTLDPESSEWHHSWEKQEQVPIVNFSSRQTPVMYPGVPSDIENGDFKEMDTQIYKCDT